MTQTEFSKITCIVDAHLIPLVDEVLKDLCIPEVFIQRAKQVSLVDSRRFLGIRPNIKTEETRALMYKFYVPSKYEFGVMSRIAEAADLHLPGRGSIYAENALVLRKDILEFNEEKLNILSPEDQPLQDNHSILCCIVQRGKAASLVNTILEMGLCVPIISFGEGMGLRNRLGLLRITIQVEKEVVYFIVPNHDVAFVENVIVHKARLDLPGQGFIFRTSARALAVNLRVKRKGKRDSAASMEQIIAALDEMRGSSEWRRHSSARSGRAGGKNKNSNELISLSIMAEEGTVDEFGKAAMDAGAGGATLHPLEYKSYKIVSKENPEVSYTREASHARETCDLIIPISIKEKVLEEVESQGLFAEDSIGIIEIISVQKAVTYSGG